MTGMTNDPSARMLESATDACWPSLVEVVGDWKMRLGKPTQLRPISAVFAGDGSIADSALLEQIDSLERGFVERRRDAVVQLIDSPDFQVHDRIRAILLEQRGYVEMPSSDVYCGSMRGLEHRRLVGPHRCEIAGVQGWKPDRLFERRFQAACDAITDEVAHIEVPSVVSTCYSDGAAVAIGRAAIAFGMVGLFNLFVVPEARGIGVGKCLVASLLEWGDSLHCSHAFLQVLQSNSIAAGLYRRVGMKYCYSYRYALRGQDRGSESE